MQENPFKKAGKTKEQQFFFSFNGRLKRSLRKREAVVWSCSVEKVFLEISQNSQEKTCINLFFN